MGISRNNIIIPIITHKFVFWQTTTTIACNTGTRPLSRRCASPPPINNSTSQHCAYTHNQCRIVYISDGRRRAVCDADACICVHITAHTHTYLSSYISTSSPTGVAAAAAAGDDGSRQYVASRPNSRLCPAALIIYNYLRSYTLPTLPGSLVCLPACLPNVQ